ncbi:hypothetical protein B4065_3348 [Caldibacillus thermoamylovorans]|nr:hypothetical protein B4065_3348 [Caldibacillus thermoamylovorans]
MEWYMFMIFMVFMLFDAWFAGNYIEKKKYGLAFVSIAICLFFLGVLIINYSLILMF